MSPVFFLACAHYISAPRMQVSGLVSALYCPHTPSTPTRKTPSPGGWTGLLWLLCSRDIRAFESRTVPLISLPSTHFRPSGVSKLDKRTLCALCKPHKSCTPILHNNGQGPVIVTSEKRRRTRGGSLQARSDFAEETRDANSLHIVPPSSVATDLLPPPLLPTDAAG